MLVVNEGPFVADHPSGELIGPSAPLDPNEGCAEWGGDAVDAAVVGLAEREGEFWTTGMPDAWEVELTPVEERA